MTLMLGVFAAAVRHRAPVRCISRCPGRATSRSICRRSTCWAIWLSILLAIGFIGVYAWQIAEESRQLADALTATELVLAREQHLSQLDGLAAAAAHELATPLSTIAVIAKELERALEPSSPHAEDVRLLREQTQRCREILAKLTELSDPAPGEPFDRAKLSALIEEVVAPHRNFGVEIDVVMPPDRGTEPVGEAQSGAPLRPRQPGRECGRLRRGHGSRWRCAGPPSRSRSRSPTTGRASRRKSSAGSASPT